MANERYGLVSLAELGDDVIQKLNQIEAHAGDEKLHNTIINSYGSNKDSNGIYTTVDYKRLDGTLMMTSTLSEGTSPNYTKDTWTFYNLEGTIQILIITWTFVYDEQGGIVSKEATVSNV